MSKHQAHLKTDHQFSISTIVTKRLIDGFSILFLAMALFMLLALFTYDNADPGWSHSARAPHIVNAGGRIGAWFADFFLSMFGYATYLWPLIMAYITWVTLRYKENITIHYPMIVLRTIGFISILFGCVGISSLLTMKQQIPLPFGAGGISGYIIANQLTQLMHYKGAALALFALLLAGITLFSGFLWLTILEAIGVKTLWALKRLFALLGVVKRIKITSKEEDTSLPNLGSEQDLIKMTVDDERLFSIVPEGDLTPKPQGRFAAIKASILSKNKGNVAIDQLGLPASSAKVKPISLVDKNVHQSQVGDYLFDEEMEHVTTKYTGHSGGSAQVQGGGRVENSKAKSVTKSQSVARSTSNAVLNGFPPLSLLTMTAKPSLKGYSNVELEEMSREVEQRLLDFGVDVQVVAVHPGPVITRFELQLAPGIKASKISGLAKDLARSLSVISVRVVEVIPGRPVVGVELPNKHREVVRLREILASEQYQQSLSPLSLALGVDIAGHPVVVDLAKMPHLLVAGTTGSGKSVGINAMLLSFLYKATPEQARLILIDPKMLELSVYADIPHLLTPVVTDMKEAANALRWSVAEMERRYQLMAALGVRNIAGYNSKIRQAEADGEPVLDPLWRRLGHETPAPALETLPYIVIVIDELADMMMVVGKKVEQLIARIAQKARAAGIHLILATQRPSVDVLTGLIKANIPTRISFQVSSKIDSRTILDQQGADQLLGYGDMLYLVPGTGTPMRVHGAFVDDHEVHKVATDWRKRGAPNYITEILRDSGGEENEGGAGSAGGGTLSQSGDRDPLYDEAVYFITETRRASISSLQRKFKIGYNRAARLIEEMERDGVVTPMETNGMREVLAPPPPKD